MNKKQSEYESRADLPPFFRPPSSFFILGYSGDTIPVRAGIVRNAWGYGWSSAAFHVKRADVYMLVRDRAMHGLIEDWYGYLENDKDIPMDEIRIATITGRPAGDQTFTETITQLTSRSLQKGKPGRPRKQKLQ